MTVDQVMSSNFPYLVCLASLSSKVSKLVNMYYSKNKFKKNKLQQQQKTL